MNTQTRIIGLSGGIACGKTTVAELFKALGASLIDADELTRVLTQVNTPAYESIQSHFGSKALNPDQTLNRHYLRERIFENSEEKIWLENLLHPLVWQAIHDFSTSSTAPYVIAIVPLLFEKPIPTWVDKTIVVSCSPQFQLQRLLERDHITEVLAKKIMASQLSTEEKCQRADYIIQNDGDLLHLKKQVAHLHALFLGKRNIG